jgi:hypothetical protein
MNGSHFWIPRFAKHDGCQTLHPWLFAGQPKQKSKPKLAFLLLGTSLKAMPEGMAP